MSSLFATAKENLLQDKAIVATLCKTLVCIGLLCYLLSLFASNHSSSPIDSLVLVQKGSQIRFSHFAATNISHLIFGIIGSQSSWDYRKGYVEAWWRPNQTRGYLYLDSAPADESLPWSSASPPYRVSSDISALLAETNPIEPGVLRMVRSILEIFRENPQGFRWLVLGDDDTIFFLDNLVNLLRKYDHKQYYYIGSPSEYILSNYWFSFNMGYGGAGLILSYPLVKALAADMESCLRRYPFLRTADIIIMACISDLGVNLSPHKGINQIDFHGDLSGFLSSHPKSPLISLHHFDMVEPIFPAMEKIEATRHLMKAAKVDESRLMQQTICYQRQQSWTISVSWGYSVHIYEKIWPRSWLQNPIETFKTWMDNDTNEPPHYMFNTRFPSSDPCEAPHVFYFKSITNKSRNFTHTIYARAFPRGMPPCGLLGSQSADNVSEIHVYSPARLRVRMDRCECCEVAYVDGLTKVRVKFRECHLYETIA